MNDEQDEFVPRDSNDGAIIKTEKRTGVPLDYLGEKIQSSLEVLAYAYGEIERHVPPIAPPEHYPPGFGDLKRYIQNTLKISFTKSLVAFLGLHNMLALANDHELPTRLLKMDRESLRNWLENIWRQGEISDQWPRPARGEGEITY